MKEHAVETSKFSMLGEIRTNNYSQKIHGVRVLKPRESNSNRICRKRDYNR